MPKFVIVSRALEIKLLWRHFFFFSLFPKTWRFYWVGELFLTSTCMKATGELSRSPPLEVPHQQPEMGLECLQGMNFCWVSVPPCVTWGCQWKQPHRLTRLREMTGVKYKHRVWRTIACLIKVKCHCYNWREALLSNLAAPIIEMHTLAKLQ